ncbi:hypothetical protein HYFRA_00007891 [Hymenoscyphus fraxineus]|uniref:Uncharacterized protein n=1 Tax=Hymenoscyphus fraxineus TaxID=746836 RepID=A0A9N9PPP4_9HELO|nr:hypothetical protein HYFRA_00007891 [Hymenoscyphus fraxineus]
MNQKFKVYDTLDKYAEIKAVSAYHVVHIRSLDAPLLDHPLIDKNLHIKNTDKHPPTSNHFQHQPPHRSPIRDTKMKSITLLLTLTLATIGMAFPRGPSDDPVPSSNALCEAKCSPNLL